MSKLVFTLFRILRLQAGPQDLPAAWMATLAIIALYLLEGMFIRQQLGDGDAAAKSLSVSALQFFAVAGMLFIRKYPERLAQTLGALAGTGVLLGLLAFIFLVQADPNRTQPILFAVWFGIFIWSLVVDAHIYRNAMSVTMPQGVLIAVLLMAASYLLIEVMF